MNTSNHHRGHETPEHRDLKPEVRAFLHDLGFGTVLCEHHQCDLVAIRPCGGSILGAEVERSSRNVIRNLSRDFSQGCSGVLIVCPDAKILAQVARLLAHKSPVEIQERTGLTTISALRLLRLPANR